jgi:dienelactone hydrolase
MAVREQVIDISVDERTISGTLVSPKVQMPGVLLVHGWAGNQVQYLNRARGIAALGCICLTFDLYGHARTQAQQGSVTREQNLRDVIASYDVLKTTPGVDNSSIAVIGSSYGGYLAALLSRERPVRWLVLRAPALYKDADWTLPKGKLNRAELTKYRRAPVKPDQDSALKACTNFKGDVLIVESENDEIIPPQVIANYRAAFRNAHSLTYRVLSRADHALSDGKSQQAYTGLLLSWAAEMVQGAR